MQVYLAQERDPPIYGVPPTGPVLADVALEQVENYCYLGVLVSSRLTFFAVGMLYRQFYSWADTNTLLAIYCTCIRPHLEYAWQLWDPFTNKGLQSLEAIQKLACKVCLKQWDLEYHTLN